MKRIIIAASVLGMLSIIACKKNESVESSSTSVQQAAAELQAVAIGVSSKKSGDSVYVVNTCRRGQKLDTVSFTSLPAKALTYLSDNYEGYTEVKAYSIKDSSGTVSGYIAVIKAGGNLVGVKFDANGNFDKVLEQREGRDLWRGDHHDGDKRNPGKDTIALSSLPVAITSYMNDNYPSDTLLYAFIKRDSDLVVISKNQGLFTTTFNSNGSFISHNQIKDHRGKINDVATKDLPAAITTYIDSKYPGSTIEKSFSIFQGGATTGYAVLIDANNTKYVLLFDKDGNFLLAKLVK